MNTVYPSFFLWLLMTRKHTLPKSLNKLKLIWTCQWVHCTQIPSTVTKSQCNRAPLGCGKTGDSHHGCVAEKSWCCHITMYQNLRGCFQLFLNLIHDELSCKVFLMKCLKSVNFTLLLIIKKKKSRKSISLNCNNPDSWFEMFALVCFC